MKTYALTIYSIKTNIAFIQAENLEEAQKIVGDKDVEAIKWMQIPMMNYMSWCEDGKPVGADADFNMALENYDKNAS